MANSFWKIVAHIYTAVSFAWIILFVASWFNVGFNCGSGNELAAWNIIAPWLP